MRKEVFAVETRAEGMSVGPFSTEGLDEAFGFAVGLGAVFTGEDMF